MMRSLIWDLPHLRDLPYHIRLSGPPVSRCFTIFRISSRRFGLLHEVDITQLVTYANRTKSDGFRCFISSCLTPAYRSTSTMFIDHGTRLGLIIFVHIAESTRCSPSVWRTTAFLSFVRLLSGSVPAILRSMHSYINTDMDRRFYSVCLLSAFDFHRHGSSSSGEWDAAAYLSSSVC